MHRIDYSGSLNARIPFLLLESSPKINFPVNYLKQVVDYLRVKTKTTKRNLTNLQSTRVGVHRKIEYSSFISSDQI